MAKRELAVADCKMIRSIQRDARNHGLLSNCSLRGKVTSLLSLMLADGLSSHRFSYWLSGTSKKKSVKRSSHVLSTKFTNDNTSSLKAASCTKLRLTTLHIHSSPPGIAKVSRYAPVHDERFGHLPRCKKKTGRETLH
ncbi:hypothetical protein PoB_006523400 [Plakobranchus ocellatus]|uniref:Uncharacterized protein n=1 Tax=Plakobranchus ocellatus TaxID=259542 RepID=A0AAV4D3L0_9GAST|nr:hypothetical protein PoB_006523400 [Plakobranchus ocellatus]